jgi:hypothetical protein
MLGLGLNMTLEQSLGVKTNIICSVFKNNKFNELGNFQDWKINIYDKVLFDNFRLASLIYNKPVTKLEILIPSTNGITNRKGPGSVTAPNGKIYCSADRTSFNVVFNPVTNTVANVQPDLGTATNKYYGGCLAPNGKVYFIGDRFNEFIAIDPQTDTSVRVSTGTSGVSNWAGIITAPNGFLYAIPRTQPSFVKIDPSNNTFTFVGNFIGSNKYRGGCLGADGKIYCIPRSASNILVLNPQDDTTEILPENYSYLGGDKWQGGSMAPNGKIYCMPSGGIAFVNGKRPVLVIDTVNNIRYLIYSEYAIANSITGPDGNIYGETLDRTPGFWFKLDTVKDTFQWYPSSFIYAFSHLGAAVGLDGAIYLTPYLSGEFHRISEPQTVDPNRVLSRFYNIA